MPSSRPRLFKIMTALLAAGTAATVVTAVAPTAVSAAGDLLTGADIQNDSITRVDIQNGTITGRQVRDGSIRAVDLHESVQGGRGPAGPEGPRGPAGADGRQADGVATWTVQHVADGSTSVNLVSTDKVPAMAVIEPLGATLTGDFSGCQGVMGPNNAIFSADGHGSLAGVSPNAATGVASNHSSGRVSFGGPAALKFAYFCYDENFHPAPVPSFDASITFAWTVRDATPTTTFD